MSAPEKNHELQHLPTARLVLMRRTIVLAILIAGPIGIAPSAAKPESAQVEGNITEVVDAAHLTLTGQKIRLIGISRGPAEALPPFEKWLRSHAALKCERSVLRERYRCVTANGVDVAEAGLLNGAGQTSDDAAPIYREREAEARQNRRGMWAKQ